MAKQTTDEKYQMEQNMNDQFVSFTNTQSNIQAFLQTGQQNDQQNMNMQINNSQKLNPVPIVESIIINNQNVLMLNNKRFENQSNNIFNHRKIVIKNCQEIIQNKEKCETLGQILKKQDDEQNIRNQISSYKQQILNLQQENNQLKQVIQKKDKELKQYGQNYSNEQQQNISSPLIRRFEIQIIEKLLKHQNINKISKRTLIIQSQDKQLNQDSQFYTNGQQQIIISPVIKKSKIKIIEEPLKPKNINETNTKNSNLLNSLINRGKDACCNQKKNIKQGQFSSKTQYQNLILFNKSKIRKSRY